jgi:hypothetical protein
MLILLDGYFILGQTEPWADYESFGFAEPAFPFGFADPGGQVRSPRISP